MIVIQLVSISGHRLNSLDFPIIRFKSFVLMNDQSKTRWLSVLLPPRLNYHLFDNIHSPNVGTLFTPTVPHLETIVINNYKKHQQTVQQNAYMKQAHRRWNNIIVTNRQVIHDVYVRKWKMCRPSSSTVLYCVKCEQQQPV